MPKTDFSKNHFMLEGNVSPDICDKLIQMHEDIPFLSDEFSEEEKNCFNFPLQKHKGATAAGHYDANIKESLDLNITTNFWHTPSAFNKIFQPYAETANQYHIELSRLMSEYIDKLWPEDLKDLPGLRNSKQEWQVRDGMLIQKYLPNQGFKLWHYENSCANERTVTRQLVFMTYLNDVPDGGTEFYFQNKTIEAKKGKTLIWPAGFTHVHKGQISKKHVKYIITGWIHGDAGSWVK